MSMGMAATIGLGLSALSPRPECDFPAAMSLERVEGGVKAIVTSVRGDYPIQEVEYWVMRLEDGSSRVLVKGNLTDASGDPGSVVFRPRDDDWSTLKAGDYLLVETTETEVQVLLVTRGGAPIGWTLGCG